MLRLQLESEIPQAGTLVCRRACIEKGHLLVSSIDLMEQHPKTHQGWRTPMVVGLVGFALAILVVVRVLAPAGWNPSATAAFGVDEELSLAYADSVLDHVLVREAFGHDGKFFFIQANDPLLLAPDEHAAYLDRPTYRAQRMLYPLLAGAGGLLGPEAILWGLIVVNLLAIGLGTAAVAVYSARLGMSPWLGLAFPLNPGIISELGLDGGGILAFALVCVAVAAVQWERPVLAVVSLTLAVLAREVMLLSALGLALWFWRRRDRRMALAMAIPGLAAVAWAGYLRWRLPGGEASISEFDWPFAGFFGAASAWMEEPAHLVAGAVVAIVILLFVLQLVRGRSDPLAAATVGFVGLAVLLSARVWGAAFDMTRAVVPLFTAVIVNPDYAILGKSPRPSPLTPTESQ